MPHRNISSLKKQTLTGLLMASALALACSVAAAQADMPYRAGGGMMQWGSPDRGAPYGGWGHQRGMMNWSGGMMGGYGMHRFDGLDLSAEQTSKINKIRDDVRKRHWALMGKMMDENARLRDLRNTERPDPAAIGKQFAKIQEMQRQMLEQSVDAENRMEALLTKEQMEQFRKMRRWDDDE